MAERKKNNYKYRYNIKDKKGKGNKFTTPYYGKQKRTETIVFDEENRKEFITGFHKRKVERRLKYEKKQKEKAAQLRIEERKERRKEITKTLQEHQARINRIENASVSALQKLLANNENGI